MFGTLAIGEIILGQIGAAIGGGIGAYAGYLHGERIANNNTNSNNVNN